MSEEQPQPPPVQPAPPEQDFSRPPQYGQGYVPPSGPSQMDRLIPTKNVKALLAYYFAVFSIVPCFTIFLGPAAIILGILGLQECKRDPDLPGKGHAITGIVLGSITLFLAFAAIMVFLIFGRSSNPTTG